MGRNTEEMKIWLFDLAHGNLSDEAIVKGFIKLFVLHELTMGNVQDDIHFHTIYGDDNCRRAMEDLKRVLNEYVSTTELTDQIMEKADLFKIRFNDGEVDFIVATDLCYDECEELINRQEKPSFYKIEKLAPDTNLANKSQAFF